MTIHCSALVVRGCWLNLSSVSEAVVLSAAELHVQKNKVETPPQCYSVSERFKTQTVTLKKNNLTGIAPITDCFYFRFEANITDCMRQMSWCWQEQQVFTNLNDQTYRIHKGTGSQTEPTRQQNTGLTPCPCVKLSRIHSRTRESSPTVTLLRTDCCTDRLYTKPPHSGRVPAHWHTYSTDCAESRVCKHIITHGYELRTKSLLRNC